MPTSATFVENIPGGAHEPSERAQLAEQSEIRRQLYRYHALQWAGEDEKERNQKANKKGIKKGNEKANKKPMKRNLRSKSTNQK